MKLSQLLGGLPYGNRDVEITAITNDSRRVEKGTLFFCIRGTNVDGHKFAESAAHAGAAAVVVDHNVGIDCQVVVSDTRIAYAKACSEFFGNPKDRLKIIGITGTNGKTTTAFLIKSMLESMGKKTGLIGTVHNMAGDKIIPSENTTPDAYELHRLFDLMVKEGCEYAVMEVSSHALDQKRVDGLRFAAGVFTNLTQDHLDYHLTMDNYIEAKRKLFDMCDVALLNGDDAYFEKMKSGIKCPVITFGVKAKTDYAASDISFYPSGTRFTLSNGQIKGEITTRTPGKFSVYNAMSSACALIAVGFDFDSVCKALSIADGVKGRAEVVPTDRDFTVLIDYAHTPDGVENILSTVNEIKQGRLVTLFGCGGDRDRTKRPIMGEIAACLSDFVIVTSDNPRTEQPASIIDDILVGVQKGTTPYVVIENRAEAIRYAIANAQKDDVIVLAGKGHETYQIIGKTKNHFDEREIVIEALKECKN